MNQLSLYLDHQAIAPLIRSLEDIVLLSKEEHQLECKSPYTQMKLMNLDYPSIRSSFQSFIASTKTHTRTSSSRI